MSEKRVQINSIVKNQVPQYVREDFPLVTEFLKQYYISQEFQGAPVDLIQNIDKYTKVDETTNLISNVGLSTSINSFETTINVDVSKYPTGTTGFPDSYGLLKIDDEIITYTGKTSKSFTGCVRGFSGISSYISPTNPEELVFNTSVGVSHTDGSRIENLSVLFLKEFLSKTKNQLTPGFESRDLNSNLNERTFIKQAKDFYSSKGTDRSYEILFKSLYGADVKIVKPGEFVLTPSNAEYRITNDLVVEPVVGDPMNLEIMTLFQNSIDGNINGYAPISTVEPIEVGVGKTYYRLSIDAGYNRDIRVDGSIYGEFTVQPKTRAIGSVGSGSTVLDVDSTVGFETAGTIRVNYADNTSGIVTYSSKSINQFFGLVGVSKTIADTSIVGVNTFAFGRSKNNFDETIQVRINSVINDCEHPNAYLHGKDDTILIKTLGIGNTTFKYKNWFYNTPTTYKVASLELEDASDKTYRMTLNKDHYFKVGDRFTLNGSTSGDNPLSNITKIIDSRSCLIKGQGELNVTETFTAKRSILRVESNDFSGASLYSANVQNLYKKKYEDEILVASSSLPFYNANSLNADSRFINFSGTFSGDEFEIILTGDHGFYTGDAVYYTPEKVEKTTTSRQTGVASTTTVLGTNLFGGTDGGEGLYFVKKVTTKIIKLAKSRSDLYNSKFITLTDTKTVSNNRFDLYDLSNRTLETQKLFRKITPPINDGTTNVTNPGFTGILVNGVEIQNYKSKDVIKYGEIKRIDVLSGGDGYDVINPPSFNVTDSVGTGATANVSVLGSLEEIRIIDPGFDYEETPKVSITGGNGSGAEASVSMKRVRHSVSFNADLATQVGLGTTGSLPSTIGFGTFHKFKTGEKVLYISDNQTVIGGLTTNSSYFVSQVGLTTIRLHPTSDDAVSGINTIVLTSFGSGSQSFRSHKDKLIVESFNIINGGDGYENKKRTVFPIGINTGENTVTSINHDFSSGEIVNYTCAGTAISGLSTDTDYYITKVDDNRFRLSSVGVATEKDLFYKSKRYIDFTSSGVGTHFFNYPSIAVNLIGKVGLASTGNTNFEAKIQPIFRGEITSVDLVSKGVGYGVSEIINFERLPNISLGIGSFAQLKPIVKGGTITEVIVDNAGEGYVSLPDLSVNGEGFGAVLTPVTKVVGVGTTAKNVIDYVNVIQGGVGYSTDTTSVDVIPTGVGANFRPILQEWRINLVSRYFETKKITSDDGFITRGVNSGFGLQYSHLYAPRPLRESLSPSDQNGNTIFRKSDIVKVNGIEVASENHSPIIGWAYDGNPIYGPYGFSSKDGGVITQIKSGYTENSLTRAQRPPISLFPGGFFVEDFTFKKVNDESFLDENNGRFCITPEFPNGTYAYFATIDDSTAQGQGTLYAGYKLPQFPYLIGDKYQSKPDEFNFRYDSNQDDFDLENTDYCRNTSPYNLIDDDTTYSYFNVPNKLSQSIDIKSVTPGVVESIGINTGGEGYKVGDTVIFNNTGTQGSGAIAKVATLLGKQVTNISVATSSITNVEIIPSTEKGDYFVIADNPHNFKKFDTVILTGLSTTSSNIEGSYSAGISSNRLAVVGVGTTSSGIGSVAVTGIVTHIKVTGNLAYPNILENDILDIGTEQVKVLNVDPLNSRIRVLRGVNGVVAVAHTVTTQMLENPRKLSISAGFKTDYAPKRNRQIYFDPSESVGLGTAVGVGIGSTVVFANPGAGITQIDIPTKAIYIKNHGLETGDQLTYSPGNGSGITVLNSVGSASTLANNQTLFAAKISADLLGISTVKVGMGTTGSFVGIATTQSSVRTLFFTGFGTGVYHSFQTNYSLITGEIQRKQVTVNTKQAHGIEGNHKVTISVNPSISTSVTVKYNDFSRRLIIDPKSYAASGVNTVTNAITISGHGYATGQKVLHTASAPSGGLSDNKIYYIVRVDDDTFKLANTRYESTLKKPQIVGITSTSAGSINLINPQIKVYKDSTVVFDLSDSSLAYTNQGLEYSAFKLNFYRDQNFTKVWEKSDDSKVFEVVRSGKVGIDTDAKVTLTVNSDIPEELFYKLDIVNESDVPEVKSGIGTDTEVNSNNQILVTNSLYNGNYAVSVGATNSFTYNVSETPERVSYGGTLSKLSYITDCTHTDGAINSFSIQNGGVNYYSLPGITTISGVGTESTGSGAIISVNSSSIGQVKGTRINDIGFDFPSDTTLKPSTSIPQVITIESLNSFDFIGITSSGRGYTVAPKLVVVDGKTKKQVKDVDIGYKIGDSEVTIFKNTFGMSNTTPSIIPTSNSNGVAIGTVGFNTTSKLVTIGLGTGYSTGQTFPFKVGDKVLIEGVSIGIGSTGLGYNSEDYEYKLFELTAVDENIGGIGSVAYNITGDLPSGLLTPGSFDSSNSVGARIVPERFFPQFNIVMKQNNFTLGETVTSDSASGVVEFWDAKSDILRISSNEDFVVNETIKGLSSKTQGIASSIRSYESYLKMGATSKVLKGHRTDSGFLNDNMQRVQDNDYYQKFSYSLNSTVPFEKWNDAVSSTNHTVGYKKFADYQLESKASVFVGVSTDVTFVDTVNDLTSVVDLNCIPDFDLVTENFLNVGSKVVSTEIKFANKILQDYLESVGNRVLAIDDISSQFNSNPRATKFSIANTFTLSSRRAMKYITYVRDTRFTAQRQLMIVDLIHDGSRGYINQYGRVESTYDQGSFDFNISGTDGQLQFFPTKFSVNDYQIAAISYNLDDNLLSTGSTSIGGVALIESDSTTIGSGIGSTTIVSIASTHNTVKVLIEITPDVDGSEFEYTNLNIIHNGTDIELLEYGQLTTSVGDDAEVGLGTYSAAINGTNVEVTFHPNSDVGIGTTGVINTVQVGLATAGITGIGTFDMKHARIEGRTTSIASSTSPGIHTVATYPDTYDVAYFIAQVADTSNNQYQMSEIIAVDDFVTGGSTQETYDTEFGEVGTSVGLGTFGTRVSAAGTTELMFTPAASINTVVNVYMNALRHQDDSKDDIDFTNALIESGFATYEGTERDIKRSFDLTHETDRIFERSFDGSDSSIVNLTTNTITLPNHFFVTGEQIEYKHAGIGSTQAIGIASTSFPNVGIATKLQTDLFVVKINDDEIKLATSAADALTAVPTVVDLTNVGIGTSHRFVATNKNAKVIVAVDNIIQSPVVSTAVTTILADQMFSTDDSVKLAGITSISGGELLKIGDEIMRIDGVGIGSTNSVNVRRSWLGTNAGYAATGTLVTKVTGNYNIINNSLTFVEAPSGNTPIGTDTNRPDERDWTGITTSSSFQGRVFMRSGVQDESNETYHKNKVYDDISQGFNGSTKEFTLKSDGSNVTGIATETGIILVNDTFQTPGSTYQYTMTENAGISSISFVGSAVSNTSDIRTSTIPVGGIIVSVGSSEGFGYQPLVAAGGTATVSIAGTIQSISIGNSGSGYRAGIQTTVNVGVATTSLSGSNRVNIGTATISGGNIVSVAITNPGTGYTSTEPPVVIFDDPLSYSNIPLIYSSTSSGLGTSAKVDIVVGQGSSVIDFTIRNTGHGYGNAQTLTVAIGGTIGIPTTGSASFEEFKITVDEIVTDEFTGWSIGQLQVMDNVGQFINGSRTNFPLEVDGALTSIVSAPGSKINVQDVLLVFVNDILQVPGKGYTFTGGSQIEFTEAPKIGDKVDIIFYKGTGSQDVVEREVLETVKRGDTLQIQSSDMFLDEDVRSADLITSTDVVKTNPYSGPGNIQNTSLTRPVIWCKQTEDKIINEQEIGKDRELYEPVISPTAHIIKTVGVGSTAIYVDTLRPLFNTFNEVEDKTNLLFQDKVKFITQDEKISAAGTAIVSTAGTITSIAISTGGFGYTSAPLVSIASTNGVGIGTTTTALGTVTIGAAGTVTGVAITNPGLGYTQTNPPLVLFSPPTRGVEENKVGSYNGDSGIIVGFGTTSVGIGTTQFMFDLHIPSDSFLRNAGLSTGVVSTAITASSLSAGDYFIVFGSNVGSATTSITSLDTSGSTVGIGTSYIDNVYQVASSETVYRPTGVNSEGVGIGTSHITRVFVTVDNNFPYGVGIQTSNSFGEFSWGKIQLTSRSEVTSYDAFTTGGVGGITTSTLIQRSKALKFRNYDS